MINAGAKAVPVLMLRATTAFVLDDRRNAPRLQNSPVILAPLEKICRGAN